MALGIIQPNKKNRAPRAFEILIANIEKSLCPTGAVVTSPHYIGGREIDATIQYTLGSVNLIIAIECRKRNSPQDVTWVEQLFGKTQGLGFSMTMGVSEKGFSKKAREYAKKTNIQLRKIDKISKADILSLISFNLNRTRYKTKTFKCDFFEDHAQLARDYFQEFLDKHGYDALINTKFFRHIQNESTIEASVEGLSRYCVYQASRNADFNEIEFPDNGAPVTVEMSLEFSEKRMYLSDFGKRYYIKSISFDVIFYSEKEVLTASNQLEYVDAETDEKLVEITEFESQHPDSPYKKFTVRLDLKSDRHSLLGETSNGEIQDLTATIGKLK